MLAKNNLRQYKEKLELLGMILNHLRTGVVFCDKDLKIQFLNKSYAKFYKIDQSGAIGALINKYFPGQTRIEQVLKNGIPDINVEYQWHDVTQIVSRVPIIEDGEIVGVIAEIPYQRVEEIQAAINQIKQLRNRVDELEHELSHIYIARYSFDQIIGSSKAIEKAKKLARTFAQSEAPVLLMAETGSGKELFAHAIHSGSQRANGPLVIINCSAIPETLFEAEFFGYEKGAFTGATAKGKRGKLELAKGGTLFLDEIGDLPLFIQSKLLRVLDGESFERVGGNTLIKTDFRLISATNRNLDLMLESGTFRRDLLHRIDTLKLTIPPLRERFADIEPLCNSFLNKLGHDLGMSFTFSQEVMDTFLSFTWPGNVRQLKNVCDYVLTQIGRESLELAKREKCTSFAIGKYHLPPPLQTKVFPEEKGELFTDGKDLLPLSEAVTSFEKKYIKKCLRLFRGNKAKASRYLGISRQTLYVKIRN